MADTLALVPAPAAAEIRLPRNVEAEAALLGALMLDNRLAEEQLGKLRPDHFFEPLHGRIYGAIVNLVDKNMIANPVTLRPLMEHDTGLKELGGAGYLAQLTGSGATVIGARDFARQIYDLALLRELVRVGREMVESALDTSVKIDPEGAVEAAEVALYEVMEGESSDGGVKSFDGAAKIALASISRAQNAGGSLSGVTTGLTGINQKVGGLHRSDLVILAGRPGMGKTSLATNIAYNAAARWVLDNKDGIDDAKNMGARTAFFSLEMSSDQLATRVLAEQSGISSESLRTGRINHQDFDNLSRAARDLQDLPLFIDDSAGLSIAALRTRARRLKKRHNIGLIVIDYLQLLQGSSKSGDNRVQEISEISRGLKTLAKELDVPVLALSQLSRAVESREDKRPQLSDLRESGSIEQDADMVWFVFREDYYEMAKEPKMEDEGAYQAWQERMERITGRAELIVAKQRHGATGKVFMHFDSRITKFTDLANDGFDTSYE